jgi:activator of 2-hydroxyglutaryl-CoA dehydratase
MKFGFDIGSVTAKAVVLDEADNIVTSKYIYTRGQPVETILAILQEILAEYPPASFTAAAATGTGGQLIADLLGIPFVNEITAQAAGAIRFHPEIRTILEIGGEDSKLIVLEQETSKTAPKVTDFAINGVCAAGRHSRTRHRSRSVLRDDTQFQRAGNTGPGTGQANCISGRCGC